METIYLKSWEEFENELRGLFDLRDKMKKKTAQDLGGESKDIYISDILFRGQSDSEWQLRTTLERTIDKPMNMLDYYTAILSSKPEIETFTGRSWDLPSSTEYASWLNNNYGLSGVSPLQVYEYMAYLRHHGFPSPLLDWTASPYVAAYFAFRGAISQKGEEKRESAVSIYAYLEYLGIEKQGWAKSPFIFSLGPTIKVHPRHFLQKCQYTICSVKKTDNDRFYSFHEDVFAEDNKEQDLLWKFVIPAAERNRVLRVLERSNIDAYSLFGSEESLMETIAIRHFS